MKLSIIIVNYNVKYFLEQCLCSVKQAITTIDTEVFVVDNSSTDGSIDYLSNRFKWVQFIINNQNEGFAKANNIALKQCSGDYVLFLNPDTIIPEKILQNCLNFFSAHIDAGAVGVRMTDGSGAFLPESKRAFPSPLVSFFKLSGLSALFPRSGFFNKYALGNLTENEVHEADVLCGAFLMAEKNLLDKIQGFDEAFFMYGEDIDLCFRIQQEGKKNYYLGKEMIIHFKGESSQKDTARYVKIFYEAMRVFVKKYYYGADAAWLNAMLRTGIFIRGGVSLLAAPFKKIKQKSKPASSLNGKKIYLVGDAESAAEAEHIFKSNKHNGNFKHVLGDDKKDQHLIKEKDEIVFCTGRFTYAGSMTFLLANKKKCSYAWHGLHSGSIAGSADINSTGMVYSLNE